MKKREINRENRLNHISIRRMVNWLQKIDPNGSYKDDTIKNLTRSIEKILEDAFDSLPMCCEVCNGMLPDFGEHEDSLLIKYDLLACPYCNVSNIEKD